MISVCIDHPISAWSPRSGRHKGITVALPPALQGGDRIVTIGGREIALGGDVILSVDGIPVVSEDNIEKIHNRLAGAPLGTPFKMNVRRQGHRAHEHDPIKARHRARLRRCWPDAIVVAPLARTDARRAVGADDRPRRDRQTRDGHPRARRGRGRPVRGAPRRRPLAEPLRRRRRQGTARSRGMHAHGAGRLQCRAHPARLARRALPRHARGRRLDQRPGSRLDARERGARPRARAGDALRLLLRRPTPHLLGEAVHDLDAREIALVGWPGRGSGRRTASGECARRGGGRSASSRSIAPWMRRVLQWVASRGLVSSVSLTTSSTAASLTVLGAPGRAHPAGRRAA